MAADFEEQLALLRELQDIDLSLHKIERELASLPEKIAGEQKAFDEINERMTALSSEREQVEHDRRADEKDLAASVEHLREREAKLYAIKTNKEYQAAIKEIAEGKRLNREREDRVLQAMERIEALGQEIAQLEADHAEKEKTLGEARKAIDAEEVELKKTHEHHVSRRPKLLESLTKDALRKYEFVRRRYTDALVEVADGVCTGCSRKLPPQLYNEVLRKEHFKACPNCQRLVYVPEPKEEPEGGSA